MKKINYFPILKNINMLHTNNYVGHLSLRTDIIYVDVIIWTSLNELGKMINLTYSENLNIVLSENSLKT